MRWLATAVLLFMGPPFWEAKAPDKWSDYEIANLRRDSPWAEVIGPDPKVLIYLATAAPIEEAEAQARLRAKDPLAEPDPDYLDYLRDNREQYLVLAVEYQPGSLEPGDEKKMEEKSTMTVGKRIHKMVGHFPPTKDDPVLRLVFPRDAELSDKSVIFRLVVPGLTFPDRQIEFRVKEMIYHGKLAM